MVLVVAILAACEPTKNTNDQQHTETFEKGSFGYDLAFLQTKDSVVVLGNSDAQVIVSPRFQGKVFTSTATGLRGQSFGWINYDALNADTLAPHINAYGGEDRFWLAPEGGQYSIFFKPGSQMVFDNWQTPAALDTEPWDKIAVSATQVAMQKSMQLQNYAGTQFDVLLQRAVQLLDANDLMTNLGVATDTAVKWVGFATNNSVTNAGKQPWTKNTGTLSIWVLSMLNPIENGAIIIPYRMGKEEDLGPVATTNYFGDIPASHIQFKDGVIYFKADGKYRSKLGLSYKRATPVAGSYDSKTGTLTIMQFVLPTKEAPYINQLWEMQKNPFNGDVINAYNDGPLEGGGQLGPFYELESSSPAAFLTPGKSISHTQRMYHFTGAETHLDPICKKVLGVSLQQIKSAFEK